MQLIDGPVKRSKVQAASSYVFESGIYKALQTLRGVASLDKYIAAAIPQALFSSSLSVFNLFKIKS